MQTKSKALLAAVAFAALQLPGTASATKEQCLVYSSSAGRMELKLCDGPDAGVESAAAPGSDGLQGESCAVPDPTVAPLELTTSASTETLSPSNASATAAAVVPVVAAPTDAWWRTAVAKHWTNIWPADSAPDGGPTANFGRPSSSASFSASRPAVKGDSFASLGSDNGWTTGSVWKQAESSWTPRKESKRTGHVEAAWNVFECLVVLGVIFTSMAMLIYLSEAEERKRNAQARVVTPPRTPEPRRRQMYSEGRDDTNTWHQRRRPVRTLSIPDRIKYGLSPIPEGGGKPGPLERLLTHPGPSKAA